VLLEGGFCGEIATKAFLQQHLNPLQQVLLEEGFAARLASLTLATHKARAFGAVEERWCAVMLQLRATHTYLHGAPWVVERWLLKEK